ncbi:TetR/AcrR family transcriptional regulator [Streptomyces sp. NBC_00121]|uniref:TetR/AcrR family transcriptional regulator n=1 Tax=unclassified Streptomyces TaxID=2593676 RepID=UPI002DDA3D91|nr:TetR/AcrR family transcriptional regulator [Streptomyces sp. NBC_01760]WSC69049.1 TetR/AcrR family transcriptional regulator [Streptomyces sp. NBC_01760]
MVEKQTRDAARGPGRPREERVTRAVLDAVLALVAEQGMNALTMDAVAVRAEVSKPAIYRRWPTKQDLLIAAAESRIGPLSIPDLGDFRAELRAVLTARVEVYRAPGMNRLIAEVFSAAADPGAGRSAYRAYINRVMGETGRILERGIVRGDVRPDTDVRSAATMVAAPLVFRLVAEQELPDSHLVESVVELVGRAVGVQH